MMIVSSHHLLSGSTILELLKLLGVASIETVLSSLTETGTCTILADDKSQAVDIGSCQADQ